MTIYPAIDLKQGRAVRLSEGLMETAKTYSLNPLDLAMQFEDMGAKNLHLVDLDGAFSDSPKNLSIIKSIISNTSLDVQVGGGIKEEQTVDMYFQAGVKRTILGSVAYKDPDLVIDLARKYEIIVGIDAKDGFVATRGWANLTNLKATDLAAKYKGSDVAAIICTDISKDGMLSGINKNYTLAIKRSCGLPTIASGGLSSLKELREIADLKEIDGIIIGKAYYEGKLDLKEALKLL